MISEKQILREFMDANDATIFIGNYNLLDKFIHKKEECLNRNILSGSINK